MAEAIDAAVARVEFLLDGFDPRARAQAEELVQALMEIYGSGLRRVLEIAGETPVLDRMAEDKLVASLLLIHGLHPVDADTRIRRALERFDRAEFLGVSDGVAKIRIDASSAPLAASIERAAREAAPEVEQVVVEGASSLVQIAL